MLRVKDPEASLKFYQSVLGMSFLRIVEVPEHKFNLYFLGYGREGAPDGPLKIAGAEDNPLAAREGLVELTWNYGTEKDPEFKYHNGNDQPQGFGVLHS